MKTPSRRAVWIWGWLSLALLAGCEGSTATVTGGLPSSLTYLGADISSLEPIEQAGGVFRDAGQAGDAVTILRAHGSSIFRLRVFVNPSLSGVEVNDLTYTVRMAGRVKASGAKLLLDLHYSDTWADPGHQATPAGWGSLDLDSLESRVESYTAGVVSALDQAGAAPDIVQVGNEIDGGMLWPLGQVGSGSDTLEQWQRLIRLIKAGIRGVQQGLPPGEPVRIMLHYSQGGSASGTRWFFDHLNAAGVQYDLIGLSYYPWWHGTIVGLETNLEATGSRYGKDIMVVETSYPWRAGGWEGMAPNRSAMTWAVSPSGQRKFLRDILEAVGKTPGNHGVGVLWWYPEAIEAPGLFIFGGGSLALFDGSGEILPAGMTFQPE